MNGYFIQTRNGNVVHTWQIKPRTRTGQLARTTFKALTAPDYRPDTLYIWELMPNCRAIRDEGQQKICRYAIDAGRELFFESHGDDIFLRWEPPLALALTNLRSRTRFSSSSRVYRASDAVADCFEPIPSGFQTEH